MGDRASTTEPLRVHGWPHINRGASASSRMTAHQQQSLLVRMGDPQQQWSLCDFMDDRASTAEPPCVRGSTAKPPRDRATTTEPSHTHGSTTKSPRDHTLFSCFYWRFFSFLSFLTFCHSSFFMIPFVLFSTIKNKLWWIIIDINWIWIIID